MTPVSKSTAHTPPRSIWPRGRSLVIGAPYLWLLIFFLLPFLMVLKISVSESDGISFQDILQFKEGVPSLHLKLSNYLTVFQDAR